MTENIEILPFTKYHGDNSHTNITDALYEFITNAMDANNEIFPDINLIKEERKIIITDLGNGLDKKHITVLGRFSEERDPNRHGSHGIGLKDAIACCVRENCVVEIKVKGKCFSFRERTPMVSLLTEEDPKTTPGTDVSIKFPKKIKLKDIMTKLKKQFLHLYNDSDTLEQLQSKDKNIEVYRCTEDFPTGAVFIKGVRKFSHPNLDFIYNFVNLSKVQKEGISRDHCFRGKSFKNFFKSEILQANPTETFQQQIIETNQRTAMIPHLKPSPPQTMTPHISDSPMKQPLKPSSDPALDDLLTGITTNCMIPDYYAWSLTNDERDRVQAVNASMHELLRTLGFSVSKTEGQGSWEKNTFVPLVSDIDIIVDINEYPKNESDPDQINQRKIISQRLKDALKEEGVRLEDSGDRIINCTYKGYQFDLVLDPKNAPRDRFQIIRRAPYKDSATMKSFIRAMKYFKARSGIDMKSCIIEEVVLKLWDQISGKTGKEAFKIFLENVIPAINHEIIDLYELEQASIDEMQSLAKQTLQKFQTL